MTVLDLKTPVTFSTSCFRSNLFYDVIFSDYHEKSLQNLKEFIDQCLCDDVNSLDNSVDINPVNHSIKFI